MKILILTLLFALSASAATYDENYTPSESNKSQKSNFNLFMNGDFDEIIRFNEIKFSDAEIDENSSATLDTIIEKIKSYEDAGKNIKVTVIGHSNRATDNKNEQKIDSGTYANKIQDFFRYSLDENSTNKLSEDYARKIESKLIDNNITKEIIYVEYRAGKDLSYSDSTAKTRKFSNRVMVTLYLESPYDIDSDRDGIFDTFDKCPATTRLSKVDKDGCPIDSDGDGVLDYKDRCSETPEGVEVDFRGCPVDSDGDGVVDYKDKCLDTMEGFSVDPDGCPLKSTLKLNFKPRSAKVETESLGSITRFANFMNANELYKAKITGHTDSIGKAVVNMKLSQNRASAVKAALVADGVDASRLTTAGRGELDPIESNREKEGRRANRRIEIELFY